jgi:hypothetical protein
MTSPRDDPDDRRRQSLQLLGVDPVIANDRDDNPPPPGESQLNWSQPLLSPPPLPDDTFTLVDCEHQGRPTTSPRDAVPLEIINPPVHLHNQFEQLGQEDANTSVSGDIVDTRFTGSVDEAASTPSSTVRGIAAIACATDATIAEINAIPDSFPVFSNDLHRLELSFTSNLSSEIGKITSKIGVMGETMSSLFSTLQQSLAHTTTELIADITRMNSNMKLFKERVEHDHISVTAAITTLSGNTARLSEETTALSARVIEHQDHLDNLLGFEEARRAQMDDHWCSIVEIKATVGVVKMTATTQTDRFTAQLDALRANTDTVTIALRTDVNDLRGRIILNLRVQSTGIASTVQQIEDKIAALSARPTVTLPTSDIPDEVPQDIPDLPSATSWYTRPNFPRVDDPAGCPHDCPQRVSTTPLDNYEGPPFVGGHITLPRSTDKERQARTLNISRHDVANLACLEYHGGPHGVKALSIQFIHACGYQSFASTEYANDILPFTVTYNSYTRRYNRHGSTLASSCPVPRSIAFWKKVLPYFPNFAIPTQRVQLRSTNVYNRSRLPI